ncbi:MAG: xanthine phosphoribosyltransferase [Candidatus Obscuribacterales bacterium]|nr:xanthine phosphoribosyltransferase [Candidatus Obscuribacterales bacterium]
MQLLKDKILNEGRYLGNGILKVDSFMNHQIDPVLMRQIGEEIARRFQDQKPTRILTAESSGIAPSLATALVLGVPVVYARKQQPVTMNDGAFRAKSESHTFKKDVELIVSSQYLTKADRILIIDDFLATARTIVALVDLVKESGATLVGIGAVIEKSFEGGREKLVPLGVQVESLARIKSFENDRPEFL